MLKRQRRHVAAAWKVRRGFALICDEYRPLWEKTITDILEADAKKARAKVLAAASRSRFPRLHLLFSRRPALRSREAIEKMLADKSVADRRDLDAEVVGMMLRTTIIVAALTVILAVFALRPSSGKGIWALIGVILLVVAVLLAAVAFAIALKPLAPPFRRAMKKPYDKRAYRTILEGDDFACWVHNTWLGDRRTPIITAYKKAHTVAVPLLTIAVVVAVPGLGLSMIFR